MPSKHSKFTNAQRLTAGASSLGLVVLLGAAVFLLVNVLLHTRQTRTQAHVKRTGAGQVDAELQRRIEELEADLQVAEIGLEAVQGTQQRDAHVSLQPGTQQVSQKRWYNSVEDIPAGSTVWVTFVNGDEKYRDLMMNWAYHLRSVNVPHIVVAFDDVAAGVCQDNGIPFIRHVETLVSGDFRADFSKFRKMGSNKPLIVLKLLQEHHFDTVIISDVDTAWMRDPSEFLLRHPTADVLISTDCLSHWIEAQHDPQDRQHQHFHRCGHLPGATYGRAFNTGVIIFRSRPATVTILQAWREYLTDPDTMFSPSTTGGQTLQVTDQLAFNIILEQNISPITSTEEDWRVIYAMNSTLKLMPLPALLFTNGHVFFYQHLPTLHHVKPYVVHCTFQRHHTPGKRARLREEGLWLVDPPDYFQAEQLLTYDNDVREYITALEGKASTSMSDLYKHLHAMSYQLAALRDAFAMARALNRTLVVPRLVCYCDQDWYASILPHCRVDGSDLVKPFLCPLDILFNPGHLDDSPLPYRTAPFLDDIRTPFNVRKSQEPVVLDSNAAWVEFRRKHNNGAGGYAAMGSTAVDLRAGLAGLERVHVLRFEGLRPGAFGGFGDAAEDAAFDMIFSDVVKEDAKWCCSGEQPIDVAWITWFYRLPTPLAALRPGSWKVPAYEAPPHCARIRDGEAGSLNVGFLRHPNHPCTFLSQGTVLPATLEDVLPSTVLLGLPQPW